MRKKTAVVLFNLGGPDSPEAVKPFLFNLFNDAAIISAPSPLRYFLAKTISLQREKTAKEIFNYLGGSSPILSLTQEQQVELQKAFSNDKNNYKVFIAMRYWKPFIDDAFESVSNWEPDEIILLPLYPQYSKTTTGSSFLMWKKIAKKNNLRVPTKIICCYPENKFFIKAHVFLIRKMLRSIKNKRLNNLRMLFSAHGLPEKVIKSGDPYQKLVELTVKRVVQGLKIKGLDYLICYQSKVGPLKWTGPSTESEIIKAANQNKQIVIVPVAFVNEHSETLVELDIEYKKIAQAHGCLGYYRVPALGRNKYFIQALSNLILKKETDVCKNCSFNISSFWSS